MYIVKYSELDHMAEMHLQARASPYELVPYILRYTFNNLYILNYPLPYSSYNNPLQFEEMVP